jgi:hypothetical protein
MKHIPKPAVGNSLRIGIKGALTSFSDPPTV